jgi:hypothetical protein
MLNPPYLPFDVLNIILEYDGRIKYSHTKRIYVNIISKNDDRYGIVESIINKKINILQEIETENLDYYINIWLENKNIGLVYDFNWIYKFQIYHNLLYDIA